MKYQTAEHRATNTFTLLCFSMRQKNRDIYFLNVFQLFMLSLYYSSDIPASMCAGPDLCGLLSLTLTCATK